MARRRARARWPSSARSTPTAPTRWRCCATSPRSRTGSRWCKLAPEAADDPTVGPDERARGLDFAARLPMRALTRAWQMLLKALEEVATAPNAMMAAEMAMIRLTHVADLPSPEELVRRLRRRAAGAAGRRRRRRPARAARGGRRAARRPAPAGAAGAGGRAGAGAGGRGRSARYARFEDVVALVRARRDMQPAGRDRDGRAAGALRARPHRVRAGATRAAPDLAARLGAAAAALDRRALGRLGGRLAAARATIAEARAARARRPAGAGARRTRWCRRCSRPSRAPRSSDVRPADAPDRRRGRRRRRAADEETTTGIRSIPFEEES